MQYMRMAKIAHLKWWRQEQISRAYDREMMMREEAYGWAVVLKDAIIKREGEELLAMEKEDKRSQQVCVCVCVPCCCPLHTLTQSNIFPLMRG